jgi:hypothetical protein
MMRFFCEKIMSLVKLICLGVVLIGPLEVSAEAQTLPPDVGLITRLAGDVTYRNESYERVPEKAQAFMRIRKGDHFKIPAEAMVQLIYFQSGRKETWKGLVVLVVGDVQSRAKGEKGAQTQPEVTILPTEASQTMRSIPNLLRRAGLSRSGTMQVRGTKEDSQESVTPNKEERVGIVTAKENYRSMRSQTEADDITPEMYLLGVLADYDKFEEMEQVIKEAQKIQSANPVLKKLEEWVKTQKTKPGAK